MEEERDRHLYFIGLDAAMPVKLMSQLSRGERAETVEEEQKSKEKEERGRRDGEMQRKKENGERWVRKQERGENREGA